MVCLHQHRDQVLLHNLKLVAEEHEADKLEEFAALIFGNLAQARDSIPYLPKRLA